MNVDLQKSADDLIKKTEERILRAYVTSLMHTTTEIDRVSTWIMFGIGASITLIISNVDSLVIFFSLDIIKISLLLMTIAALFGFLQKIVARDIKINLTQEEKLRSILDSIFENYNNDIGHIKGVANLKNTKLCISINTEIILKKFYNLHPNFIKFRINNNDELNVIHTRNISQYYKQEIYFYLEFVFFIIAFILLALNI